MRRQAALLPLLLIVGALHAQGAPATAAPARPVGAQAVTPDDLAAVMLGPADLPAFVLAGDVSPDPSPGRTSDQRTRFFFDAAGDGGQVDILTEVLSAPNDNAVCLPYLPGRIANGDVLSLLNSDMANFQLLGPLGVGDVDVAAAWNDLDTGSNTWDAVFSEVFMRGRLSVYLTFRRHSGAPIDPQQIAAYARTQDARLLTAEAEGGAIGALAAAPVPPPPATTPDVCGLDGGT